MSVAPVYLVGNIREHLSSFAHTVRAPTMYKCSIGMPPHDVESSGISVHAPR